MAELLANVFKKGALAATFEHTDAGLKFEYLHDYLANQGAPVASTLPIHGVPITLPNGAAPAFFAGLLPEGRRLDAMARRIKTSRDNDIALLTEIGQDLIGDVQVLAPGGDPNDSRPTLELDTKYENLDFDQIREQQFGSAAGGIPGVQDKVSSKMLNVPARRANVEHILKFNPMDAPFAVENECLFLGLASRCGLDVAPNRMLTDSVGQHALLIERFDRISTPTTPIKLAAEDGCQVLNLYPADKYEADWVSLAQGLINLCPSRGVAGFTLFKQLVFNWLVGNGDAHAKNFSVLEGQDGEFMISPAYDLLCTFFYEDKTMALPVDGQASDWSRKSLIEVAQKIRVPARAAEKVIDHQLATLANLPEQIISGALPFRRDQNFDAAKFLKQRAKRLAD